MPVLSTLQCSQSRRCCPSLNPCNTPSSGKTIYLPSPGETITRMRLKHRLPFAEGEGEEGGSLRCHPGLVSPPSPLPGAGCRAAGGALRSPRGARHGLTASQRPTNCSPARRYSSPCRQSLFFQPHWLSSEWRQLAALLPPRPGAGTTLAVTAMSGRRWPGHRRETHAIHHPLTESSAPARRRHQLLSGRKAFISTAHPARPGTCASQTRKS